MTSHSAGDEAGTIRIVDAQPHRLVMIGEVDLAVVARLRTMLGVDDDPTQLAEALDEVTEIDMTEVTFADSSALGVIGALVLARQRSGAEPVVVIGARPTVRSVLEISGMAPFLDLR
ncbi:STAS domain-containing protein [Cellulomonas sp. NPDC089187]|uniref:STAS domain-containing protein n=1 Tax=Cellulomonas sp. NPDC089187 TaxID=3154970 RepID=UPI0034423942